MVQPWLLDSDTGLPKGRRSVEKSFIYYDPPGRISDIIRRQTWQYSRNSESFKLRDLALMSILYWSSSRISEIVRARVYQKKEGVIQHIGSLPSLKASQFVESERDFLNLRDLRIMKRQVKSVSDYPMRKEILFPLKGDLSVFTEPVLEYLDTLGPNEELFPFMNKRGFQIVERCTRLLGEKQGLMPHYLREMGLKFRLRLYEKNIKTLQNFSGHRSLKNLLRYLAEVEDTKAILGYKFHKEETE